MNILHLALKIIESVHPLAVLLLQIFSLTNVCSSTTNTAVNIKVSVTEPSAYIYGIQNLIRHGTGQQQ